MPDDPAVAALVDAARDGDRRAWALIVERFAPLVWGVCRRHRLSQADAEDVGQTVWLTLFEHLGSIREPAALPGWLLTTTHHACLRIHRTASRAAVPIFDTDTPTNGGFDGLEEELEREYERMVLRDAFAQLRPVCRELLTLLFSEVPMSYREIADRLDMKVGSIGPTRERCLDQLRRTSAVTALIEADQALHDGGDVRT